MRIGIAGKLALVIGLVGTVAVLASAAVFYHNERDALISLAGSHLDSVAAEKAASVRNWVQLRERFIRSLSRTPQLREAAAVLSGRRAGRTDRGTLAEVTAELLDAWAGADLYEVILLLDAGDGRVMAASDPAEVGKFKENRPWFRRGHEEAHVGRPYYSMTLRQPALYAAGPVRDRDGTVVAVVAARLSLPALDTILTLGLESWRSMDAYLLNRDNLPLTQPRFASGGAVLKRGIHTEAARRCLDGDNGRISGLDYRDETVLSNYRWMPDLESCLLVDIGQTEILAPLAGFLRQAIIAVLVGAILAMLIALALARGLVRPILALKGAADQLMQGAPGARTGVRRGDELGELADSFDSMAETLERNEAALAERARALERSNLELERFAYASAHDLKTPLQGIDHISRWIEADLGDAGGPELREHLDLLRGRVSRMSGLLDGLLQYSRIGASERRLEAVDTAALVAEAAAEAMPPAGFRVTVADGMPTLTTDRFALKQTFANLIANALRHHDRDTGEIRVSGEDRGDHCTFAVADDGPGIEPRYHDRIFAMFQTLRPKDEVATSGVGLALVQKTVEMHGGSVAIDSDPAQGRGTTFRFTWRKQAGEADLA